jgi:hypothetical protein
MTETRRHFAVHRFCLAGTAAIIAASGDLAAVQYFPYNTIMPKSITVKRKKRGRPATGVDPLVGVRLPPKLIEQIDELAAAQVTNRSEAIRELLQQAINKRKR